ncbi:MAG TPA: J domain-containing protein [Terracidiphilus sp.]|jgi:hypothetical protein
MSCVCAQCLQHFRTLGLAEAADSKAALRKAYHEAAKTWHPDRFENDPAQRFRAEENFKVIQAAYTELSEHFENPIEPPLENPASDWAARPARADHEPPIHFNGAPGCYTGQDFPPQVLEIIWHHVRDPDRALAMVDLSRHGSPLGDLSQFILLTQRGIYIRDAQGILLLVWYDDLGELRFVDRRRDGKLPLRHRFIEKISGTEQKYSLEIYRRDGGLFYAIASHADDSVKKVIYHFLQQMKPPPHP